MEGLSVDVEHEAGAFRLRASFEAAGGVTALFGHSGSGKTTLVNVVGGLVRPRRGRVLLDGTTLLDTERRIVVPPHRRRIGYVFQEGRLFPHMSVRQNLAFGGWFAPRAGRDRDPGAVVDLLGIGALLDRKPGTLSGGEKQRVAIGRALLSRPRLLLMDEPLASLDESRKAEILPYLERLRDEAGIPILYVSHALSEVARLATTVVLMTAGAIVAAGPVATMLSRLDLPNLSGRPGSGAVLDARIERHDEVDRLTTLATAAGPLRVPLLGLPPGTALRVQIAARDVMLSARVPEGLSALNVLPGTVAEIAEREGASVDVRLDCGGATLLARITRLSARTLELVPGRPVHAIVKSVSFESRAPAGERS